MAGEECGVDLLRKLRPEHRKKSRRVVRCRKKGSSEDVQRQTSRIYLLSGQFIGGPIQQRPAFVVARFIQKGGTFVKYYTVSVNPIIKEGPTLEEQQKALSSLLAMTMMLLLVNTEYGFITYIGAKFSDKMNIPVLIMPESFLHRGQPITLTVQLAGDALHVFANGHLSSKSLNSSSFN
ncbi:hypothetical protein RHSIM_Rhsim04G0154900 [Rhododendron simsii]|uniref:Uncharacterized protein n=1 Tax=Rhododendron simsii TaxID=118357 RepID=A0A834LRE6_RHOSS|nr:hypothetical protein RHSIM_Rhsim04G0154900 [Rhododendron simsii]